MDMLVHILLCQYVLYVLPKGMGSLFSQRTITAMTKANGGLMKITFDIN